MQKRRQDASKVAIKQEDTDQKRQELIQKPPVVTQEIQELSSALTTAQDTTQPVGKAAQLAEKAKEKEEIDEKLKYGATEAEVVAAGQAWSLAAGTSGRSLDIVTMHHADVPQDATEPAIKSKIAQINDCLKKLTTGSNLGNSLWKVLKAEPIPHISKREMRRRIWPVHNSIYPKEEARQFHEGVIPECFGDSIHYTSLDLGHSAGMVKVVGAPISARVSKELTDNIILEN